MDQRPAQIPDRIFLIDLFDLVEHAVDRIRQRHVLIDRHAVFGELTGDAAPLREILGLRGRFNGHHIVADRLIEMFAVGVEVEIWIILKQLFSELRNLRDGSVGLHRIARWDGDIAVETNGRAALA